MPRQRATAVTSDIKAKVKQGTEIAAVKLNEASEIAAGKLNEAWIHDIGLTYRSFRGLGARYPFTDVRFSEGSKGGVVARP